MAPETPLELSVANSNPRRYAYSNKTPTKSNEQLETEIESLFCDPYVNLRKFIPAAAALEFKHLTVPSYRNKLLRARIKYHQKSGHLSTGESIARGELADWIHRDNSFKKLNTITAIVNARPDKIVLTGITMRTVIGQVRVATKPDPENFEDALAAYIESDFEVHRLMVENSNLKHQLEKLLAEKEKRAESNRENARQTRRKRN
jgi:hypothetical protein